MDCDKMQLDVILNTSKLLAAELRTLELMNIKWVRLSEWTSGRMNNCIMVGIIEKKKSAMKKITLLLTNLSDVDAKPSRWLPWRMRDNILKEPHDKFSSIVEGFQTIIKILV
jgi:hypothetical protein